MMKKPTDKLATNPGYNNPPVNPKSVDFINLKIYNVKIILWTKLKI
ncbi:hypothetical protein ABXT48_05415 [Candidatus Pelagibacter sp. Uisw_101]